jgi:hypothetical protein
MGMGRACKFWRMENYLCDGLVAGGWLWGVGNKRMDSLGARSAGGARPLAN